MTISQILESGPATPSELMERTDMSKSTFYRILNELIKEGAVKKNGDGTFSLAKRPPSAWEIMLDMEIIFQQKNMDKNYRRKANDEKADAVLVFYIDYQLKGNIEDYNQESLRSEIFNGLNLFIERNNLYSK